mgnify:CR=1 FL=1
MLMEVIIQMITIGKKTISQFKEKVKNSKVEIEAKKKTIQNVIKKEGEEDESFILKLKEKLDKE